ncbi:MAG: hypothetical protein HUJ76_09140 [Parasporobacterium sp.]|nr:hypothetical protein [Parasporobacterium sp.]
MNGESTAHRNSEKTAYIKDLSEVMAVKYKNPMVSTVGVRQWEYESFSQEELPYHSTEISIKGSVLSTDLSLDKNVKYADPQQAYIDHTKGSVILIKSTNTDISIENSRLVPDENGTGLILQTLHNNDTMFMNAVPEDKVYPGINVMIKDSELAGDIAHEDYQRDMTVIFDNSCIMGAINEYDLEHWKNVSAAEGFTDFCIDESYNTEHGINVELKNQSKWVCTERSEMTSLVFDESSEVLGVILVDGNEVENRPGEFRGNICVVVLPAGSTESAAEKTTEEPASENIPEETAAAHEHNWVRDDGGNPSDCTHEGGKPYICTICGDTYTESIPAMGHDWYLSQAGTEYPYQTCYNEYTCSRCGVVEMREKGSYSCYWYEQSVSPASCMMPGFIVYECSYCHRVENAYTDGNGNYLVPATGHNYVLKVHIPADCVYDGYDYYQCTSCGMEQYEYYYSYGYPLYPAYGHTYGTAAPDYIDGQPAAGHIYYCSECVQIIPGSFEYHYSIPCPACGWNGEY